MKQLSAKARKYRDHLILLVIIALPMFLARPGWMTADTKVYLYTNPAKLMARAVSMWDTHVGLGTVTHQNLGYLFPMGPYYWLMDILGVPDWIAQRIWWSGLLLIAALGARALARRVGITGSYALLAAGLYAVGPYYLQYLSKESGLLPSWSAAPWLIVCGISAAENSGWRWPARFGLVVALISSLNAATPIYVLVGPVAWLLADVITGRNTLRRVVVAGLRCGATTIALCFWWMVGLSVQGKYGVRILHFTETYDAVVKTSLPQEILRGIGYWFFYGDDTSGHWVSSAGQFMTSPLVLTVGFVVVLVSLTGLLNINHQFRFNVVFIMICGLGIAVGGAPKSSPTPYGRLFLQFAKSDAGLSIRSTPRAAPLVLLALALGFAAAVSWVSKSLPLMRSGVLVGLASLLVAINGFPLFTGGIMSKQYTYKEVPKYWKDVIGRVDGENDRVYEFPGTDFPKYNWGGTVDPISPGLTDASIIARELVPLGGDPTANLVNAMETPLQNGIFEPATLMGFSRLIHADKLLLRNDLNYAKYRTPRPSELWWSLTKAAMDPVFVGPELSESEMNRIIDGQSMSQPSAVSSPSVALFNTDTTYRYASGYDTNAQTVVFGDGSGLIDLAALNMIGHNPSFLYDVGSPTALAGHASRFILTDTNRRQARHWYSVGFTVGRTERADEQPADDPSDTRLEPFASSSPEQQSVSELVGDIASIDASGYGNGVTFTNEDRPENALDGDSRTAWRTSVFRKSGGEFIEINLRKPVTTDHIVLVQPQVGAADRMITRVRIETDGGNSIDRDLHTTSTQSSGESVNIGRRTFSKLRITILADSYGLLHSYAGVQGVGFAEIKIPEVANAEYIRLPKIDTSKYLDLTGSPWTVVLTRDRIMQSTSNQFEPELNIQRLFTLPTDLQPSLKVTARLSGMAEDSALSAALGLRQNVTATNHLYGSPANAGMNAMDGDEHTVWIPPILSRNPVELRFLQQTSPTRTIEIVALTNGENSVPSAVTVTDTSGTSVQLGFKLRDGRAILNVPEGFGQLATLSVSAVDPVVVKDYFSGVEQTMPVAIAEIIINGQENSVGNQHTACRSDLLFVDDKPVSLRVPELTADQRWNRQPFELSLCGNGPDLGAGSHQLRTAKGWDTAIDIDRIAIGDLDPVDSPQIEVTSYKVTETKYMAELQPSLRPVLLSFNQSINSGWTARINGIDLGAPVVINGYANGWIVPASELPQTVEISWTPQSRVDRAIWISSLAFILCMILALRRARPLLLTKHSYRRRAILFVTCAALLIFGGVGAVVGIVAALSIARIRSRRLLTMFLVTAMMGVIWAFTLYKQLRYRIPASMDWPSHFTALAPVTWAAVAAICVLAVSLGDDPETDPSAD